MFSDLFFLFNDKWVLRTHFFNNFYVFPCVFVHILPIQNDYQYHCVCVCVFVCIWNQKQIYRNCVLNRNIFQLHSKTKNSKSLTQLAEMRAFSHHFYIVSFTHFFFISVWILHFVLAYWGRKKTWVRNIFFSIFFLFWFSSLNFTNNE